MGKHAFVKITFFCVKGKVRAYWKASMMALGGVWCLCLNCSLVMMEVYFWFCICICLLNTSKFVKHKLLDSTHAKRAWSWVTFIMYAFYGIRTFNYGSFQWKQTLLGEMVPKKFVKKN